VLDFGNSPLSPFISDIETEAADTRYVYVVRDDREQRRAAMASLRSGGFETRPFGTIQDFLDALSELKPGCLVLDLIVDGSSIPHLVRSLGDQRADFPMVVAIRQGEVASAVEAMKLGASDVIEAPLDYVLLPDLLDSIFTRLEQHSSRLKSARSAHKALRVLTPRESDILRGLSQGLNNKQLACHLGLSVRTVESYRASMMDQLSVTTLAAALRIAFEADIAPLFADAA